MESGVPVEKRNLPPPPPPRRCWSTPPVRITRRIYVYIRIIRRIYAVSDPPVYTPYPRHTYTPTLVAGRREARRRHTPPAQPACLRRDGTQSAAFRELHAAGHSLESEELRRFSEVVENGKPGGGGGDPRPWQAWHDFGPRSGAATFLCFKTRYTKFFYFSYHSSHKRKNKEYISLSPPQSRVAWQGSLPRAATSCHGG